MGGEHTLLASYPHRNPQGLVLSRGNERVEISRLIKQQTCHRVFTQRHVLAASQCRRPGQNFQFKSFATAAAAY